MSLSRYILSQPIIEYIYLINNWNGIFFLFVWNGNEKQLKKRWNGSTNNEMKWMICFGVMGMEANQNHSLNGARAEPQTQQIN